MDSQFAVDRAIEVFFKANWSNGVVYHFMNAPAVDPTAEYINVLSMPDSRQNISMGSNLKKRCFCSLIGEIRTPLHNGDGIATGYADTFGDLFENTELSGINFLEARLNKITTPSHFGVNVIVPYYWDKQ